MNVKSTKYLGVLIGEDLNWHEHIQLIINKLLKFCGLFYKLRVIMPQKVLKKLYFALVHPHIVYCVEIYANTYLKHLDPLIKLNNKILRIIQNRKTDYPVKNLYAKYNTLPVPQLHELYIATFMHKFKFNKTKLPYLFQNYFNTNSEVHTHNTRQIEMFHSDRANSSRGQRSIKIKGGKIWNEIPTFIKEYRNLKTFKKN
jgi:hypothetical protein